MVSKLILKNWKMEIKLRESNKWAIDVFKDGKCIHSIAIPPKTSGERIDFIDRRWKYHYAHTGAISHGFLIIIKDGDLTLQYIKEHTLTRLRRIL
jgi:hypothetical protein